VLKRAQGPAVNPEKQMVADTVQTAQTQARIGSTAGKKKTLKKEVSGGGGRWGEDTGKKAHNISLGWTTTQGYEKRKKNQSGRWKKPGLTAHKDAKGEKRFFRTIKKSRWERPHTIYCSFEKKVERV